MSKTKEYEHSRRQSKPEQMVQGLRRTTPEEVTGYLEAHWNDDVRVELVPSGEYREVPKGWHGEGMPYEAMAHFGTILTESIAGTELSAGVFMRWLKSKGFTFESENGTVDAKDAAALLEGDQTSDDGGIPIIRASRTGENGQVAIQVEFFGGSKSRYMKALTKIGNTQNPTEEEKNTYRDTVGELMPFLSKGTTAAKKHLKINKTARKVERTDDCGATGATAIGDKLISDALGEPTENLFEVDQYAVLTLQAAVISIFIAEKRGVPLLIRAGAASLGVDGSVADLGYMRNAQREMIALGSFTSGDFGLIMKQDGDETRWKPELLKYGHGSYLHERRYFLSGGGPIMEMMYRKLRAANKAKQGVISIRRAKRVDSGEGKFGKKPKDWALAISGINFRYQADYTPRKYPSMIE